jgi:hypothetical protein
VPKVTLQAVVDVPAATAPVLKAWFEGWLTSLNGQIEGLTVESVGTEVGSEQAARKRPRLGPVSRDA